MANPQKENGNTQIANEILEALLQANLNSTELKCVLFVIRKTYGWHKKADKISITQFEKNLKLSRPTICKALKKLLVNKILLVNKSLLVNEYSLNKDYDKWLVTKALLVNKPKLVNKTTSTSKQNVTKTSKQTLTHKRKERNNTKEIDTNVSTAKAEYGNKDINLMLLALKKTIGIEAFADSSIERNMARHCINLIGKIGKDEFKRRLVGLLEDSFQAKNCNKIKYVYNNIKGWKEPTQKVVIIN